MRASRLMLLLTVVAFALVGCGGGGGGEQGGGGEGGGGEGLVPRDQINIEYVTHATPDPFWTVVQNGVNRASEDLGVEVNYRELQQYNIPQMQRNLEAAISAEPDGMVVSIPDPNALNDTIRRAVDAGIPVVVANSGETAWEDAGAFAYVGQTEFDAGVAAGERMAEEGVQNALCINHEQGNVALDDRCAGFTDGLGGNVEQVAVTTDPTAARNAMGTALQQNPDVDGMITLNPGVAEHGLRALEESGRGEDVTFATFDVSPSVLEAIRDGNMLFATDQQQFLQGYLPIVLLTNYVQYGVRPVSAVIPTGPAFITQDNAEQVIQLSEEGLR
jgi:simple sugar transport system substrate-binding protein